MDIEDKIEETKKRFELSRAALMTQMFVTLATANGGGMATVIAILGQIKNPTVLINYLTIIVFMLGFGLCFVLASAFYRFEHSKVAESEKIAKLKNDTEKSNRCSKVRIPLMNKYKIFMKVSLACLIISIFIGMIGAIHSYVEQRNKLIKNTYNIGIQQSAKDDAR